MKILITGITGTIGTELTKNLVGKHELVGLSRDELKQSKFLYKNDVEMRLGDIRDLQSVVQASKGCSLIIHTAALKHVDLMELNPLESIKTNIVGTNNILQAQEYNGVGRVTMLSTDKAVYPINVYGYSKGVSERLVTGASRHNQVVRYGNVLNSRGSVVSIFKKQLKENGVYNITHPMMTRFWIKIEDATNLILNVIESSGGGVHVPEMKGSRVSLLADAIYSEMQEVDCEAKYNVTGLRPGEKINECLKSRYEVVSGNDCATDVYSDSVSQYSLQEMRSLVRNCL
jgi:UDP-glucose 4-epimerase